VYVCDNYDNYLERPEAYSTATTNNKLELAGHMSRISDDRIAKQALLWALWTLAQQ